MSTLRQTITTSMAMLPFSMAIVVLVWLAEGTISVETTAGVLMALLATLALRWVSNALQLIRVRSWAVSSVFALLVAATAPLHGWDWAAMGMCLLYLVHLSGLLFSTEGGRPQLGVFISSLALAAMSLMEPLALWLVVPMLVAMLMALRVMTGRSLTAVLFGLLLPYEFWVVITRRLPFADTSLIPLKGEILKWLPSSFGVEECFGVSAVSAALLLFALIAIVHFLRTSIDDKLITRMRYVAVLLQWPVLTAVLLLWWPDRKVVLPCLALCSAPLIGRYLVFSRGWGAAVVCCLLTVSLIMLCLWPFIF